MDEITGISSANGQQLSPQEMAEVARLAAADRDVRAHEGAHLAAAGALASGGIQYTYEEGPDGKMYAVGGKVDVVVTPGATPEETLAKARQLRAAANAPADPSDQDTSVAAKAGELEARAMRQIAEQRAAAESQAGPQPRRPFRGLDVTA